MQIPIPWGLIAIFISLGTFYYFNKKARIKKQERRDRLNEKRQEFLDAILKNKKESDENEHQEK
jgi:hypothetical protein